MNGSEPAGNDLSLRPARALATRTECPVDADPGQHEIVQFLSRLPGGEAASIIVTHGARLFLYADQVYKLKRAVRYSYLDMRELAQRERLCRRELELNRPWLPDCYLEVLPVTRTPDGTLALGGPGAPVDWVVHMRRFDEACVLDNLAQHGQLSPAIGARLGRAVARYHQALEPAGVTDGHARMLEIVAELEHELRGLHEVLPPALSDAFLQRAYAELSDQKQRLDQRALDGFVRRCHGDLHLRNLLMQDNEPLPFDALEFDERLATIDVLYDLAFLLMDLQHRDLHEPASQVLNAWLLHSRDSNVAGLALLPLFLGCRAAIRAMTTAQSVPLPGSAHPGRGADGSNSAEQARRYLQEAVQSLHRPTPTLIGVGGLSGSGKSTLAQRLAAHAFPAPGAVLLRSDAERKVAAGLNEFDELPATAYTPEASIQNYRLLADKARCVLAAGWPVIVDATFLCAREQGLIEGLAAEAGVTFHGLWLEAPEATLRKRVSARANDASDATLEVLERQLRNHEPALNWQPIDAAGDRDHVLQQASVLLP